MRTIRCLIVDDEPIAREIVASYCAHVPALEVAGTCDNALDAKRMLQQMPIDILFLDIQMPVLDGLNLLKIIKRPPQVIFTTAFKEHAVTAFDLAACDYLLKPFSLERFIVAVDKALERLSGIHEAQGNAVVTMPAGSAFVRTDGKIYKIDFDDILYAEANGNYTRVVTLRNTLLPNMSFTAFEKLVPDHVFLRVHRSFIVNRTHITLIEGNRVFVRDKEIPIGSSYRESFLKTLGLEK